MFNKKKNKDIVINERIIRDNLYLSDVPDPDILIRTGGFQRLSNFLLFRLSYTDLFFTKTLWPDITKREIINIFNEKELNKANIPFLWIGKVTNKNLKINNKININLTKLKSKWSTKLNHISH